MDRNTVYDNGKYLANNPTWHEEDSPWKARHIAALLLKNGIRPKSLCEVGCGAGGVLAYLAGVLEPDVEFTGFDVSRQAVELCKTRGNPRLRYVHGDFLQEDHGHIDVVAAIDVFEHVDDYMGFLRALREKGVYKVFHIPLDLSAQAVLRGTPLMRARSLVGHLHYFTKDTALATLKDTGYEVLDYHYTKRSLELASAGWSWKLLEMPRRILFAMNEDVAVRMLGGFSLLVLAK